jgi:hypothetical protein
MFLPLTFQLERCFVHSPRGHQLTRFIYYDLPAWSGDHLLDSAGDSGTTAITALAGDLKLL